MATKILFWNIDEFDLQKLERVDLATRDYFEKVFVGADPDIVALQEVKFPAGDCRIGEVMPTTSSSKKTRSNLNSSYEGLVALQELLQSCCPPSDTKVWRVIPPIKQMTDTNNVECNAVFFREDRLAFEGPSKFQAGVAGKGGNPRTRKGKQTGKSRYPKEWADLSGQQDEDPWSCDLLFTYPGHKESPESAKSGAKEEKSLFRRPTLYRFSGVSGVQDGLSGFELVVWHCVNSKRDDKKKEQASESLNAWKLKRDKEDGLSKYPLIVGGDFNMTRTDISKNSSFQWLHPVIEPTLPEGVGNDPNKLGWWNTKFRKTAKGTWIEDLPESKFDVAKYRRGQTDHVRLFLDDKNAYETTVEVIDLFYVDPDSYRETPVEWSFVDLQAVVSDWDQVRGEEWDKSNPTPLQRYVLSKTSAEIAKLAEVSDHLPLLLTIAPKRQAS